MLPLHRGHDTRIRVNASPSPSPIQDWDEQSTPFLRNTVVRDPPPLSRRTTRCGLPRPRLLSSRVSSLALVTFLTLSIVWVFSPELSDSLGLDAIPGLGRPLDGDRGTGVGGLFGGAPEEGGPAHPLYTLEWPEEKRAEAVKEAFLHAWRAYERYAMPADELRPLKNGSVQNLNGWGLTVYDSLDTLWLMGLKQEFNRAARHVSRTTFTQIRPGETMFFETVIRYLGGLLSAYALSRRSVFLAKADELGAKLLPAFGTPSGMPSFGVNVDTGLTNHGPRMGSVVLAEVASCQLEFKYLAHLTGKEEYFRAANRTMQHLERGQLQSGLWNTQWNIVSGEQVDRHQTIGALADSAYEYLLKQYLLSGRSETRLLDMYLKAVHGMLSNLLYLSPTRELLYATDTNGAHPSATASTTPITTPTRRFEHLSCFLPGLLALGAYSLRDASAVSSSSPYAPHSHVHTFPAHQAAADLRVHAWAAEGLARTCWTVYADQPTGLAPEVVMFARNRATATTMRTHDADGARPPAGGADEHVWGGHGGGVHAEWRRARGGSGARSTHSHESTSDVPAYLEGRWWEALQAWRENATASAVTDSAPPGVSGEVKPLPGAHSHELDYMVVDSRYLLRPETVESIYIMWRTTRNPIWRERAWRIFLAIEANCRSGVGYTSVRVVHLQESGRAERLDDMPSYALAETWKYLYLTFIDEDPLPMDKWVFNTEAHPFPIFEWSEREKRAYGIL